MWESCLELGYRFIKSEGSTWWNRRTQLRFARGGCVGLEYILLHAEFLRLNLRQPVEGLQVAAFSRNSGFM